MTQRIYIDSEFRDSGTTQNFQYSLRRPFEVQPASQGFVVDVTLPNVFESVIPDHNDLLYVRVYQNVDDVLERQDYTVQLTNGQYNIATLAAHLEARLTDDLGLDITVTVQGARLRFATALVYPERVEMVTKDLLRARAVPSWTGAAINYDRPNDACNLCGINYGATAADAALFHSGADYRGAVVQLVPYKVLYLHSNIGDSQSYGAQGESGIVRRISVTGTCGDMIHDSISTEIDLISLPRVLNTFWFALRDKYGRDVDLLGHSMQIGLIVKE
jgi:hypothetical protein